MATQDIIFSSLVCIGIFSAIKSYKSKRKVLLLKVADRSCIYDENLFSRSLFIFYLTLK